MNAARVFVTAALLVALVTITGRRLEAGSGIRRCAVQKLGAVGKEIAGQMACWAKAKKARAAVDPGCLSAQQTSADAIVGRAGDLCLGTGAAIDAAVESCVGAFVGNVPADGACPSTSAAVMGQSVKTLLACQAGGVGKPRRLAACRAMQARKIPRVLVKAGSCADATGTAADADACAARIDAVLGLPLGGGTTTTTLVPRDIVCCAHPVAPACEYTTSSVNCVAGGGTPSPDSLCNPATGACSPPPIQTGSCCTLNLGISCSAGPFYDLGSHCTGEGGTKVANAKCPAATLGGCVVP